MIVFGELYLTRRLFLASRSDVEGVLGARQAYVHDAAPLADRQRDGGRPGRCLFDPRVLVAAPVLHHEPQAIRVEEETLGVAWSRWAQVDQEEHRELEALG